ncbi:MAG: hypothetical protein AAB790_00855 [Patescibacteria group bacterium]
MKRVLLIILLVFLPQLASATTVYLTSGTGWTVPSDWNSSNNTIEVIGGGGAGSNGICNPGCTGGNGGGGGEYRKVTNIPLSGTVTYSVGIAGSSCSGASCTGGTGGDTYFCNSALANGNNCSNIGGTAVVVGAKGGTGGVSISAVGIGGGQTGNTGGVGTVSYLGGNGGRYTGGRGGVWYSGGGGGAAGPNANGNAGRDSGSGRVGGQGDGIYGGAGGTADGGIGGNGTEWDATHGAGGGGGGGGGNPGWGSGAGGGAGGAYGAGGGGTGGGGYTNSNPSGSGSGGLIVITYTPTQTLQCNGTQETFSTPGTYTRMVPTYSTMSVTVNGAGGGGGNAYGIGRPGTLSSFNSTVVGNGGGEGAGGQEWCSLPPGTPGTASGGDTNTTGGGASGGAAEYCGSAGGNGGRAIKAYTSSAFSAGSTISIVVGAGGSNGTPASDGSNGSVTITCSQNSAPTTPVIAGPTSGFTKTNYTYTFRSTDPDSDTIRYAVDWDDNGSIDEYVPALGYVSSGTTGSAVHSWNSSNTQTFKALAQDSLGNTSGWASYTVNMSPNAPTVLLTAAPSSITNGQSSTLTWSSTNANSCTGTNFSTGGATQNTSPGVSVSPVVTTTYTVTCTGAGGTVSDSEIVTYTCTATNICSGQNVVNSCTGAIVQACSYQCGGGACIPPPAPVPNPWATGISGSRVTAPTLTGTHHWRVDCTGAGGTARQDMDHLVSCTPSTTYTCDGSSTIVSTTLSAQCTTSTTRTTCAPNPPYFCSAGSSTCLSVPPVVNSNGELRVSPMLVPSGAFTKVFWDVSNVTTCTVTGDNLLHDTWTILGTLANGWTSTAGAAGKTSSAITARTTFTLSCIGLDSSVIDDTAVVNILPIFEEQ